MQTVLEKVSFKFERLAWYLLIVRKLKQRWRLFSNCDWSRYSPDLTYVKLQLSCDFLLTFNLCISDFFYKKFLRKTSQGAVPSSSNYKYRSKILPISPHCEHDFSCPPADQEPSREIIFFLVALFLRLALVKHLSWSNARGTEPCDWLVLVNPSTAVTVRLTTLKKPHFFCKSVSGTIGSLRPKSMQ